MRPRSCLVYCTALLLALLPTLSPGQVSGTATQPPSQGRPLARPVHIRILNARTNKPVTDEKLNIWLRPDQIGSVPTATDKNGDIFLDPHDATTVRVLSNFYADCRPRGELYTDYSIATIRASGLTAGNLCSSAHPEPRSNQLLLYVIPKTYIRTMGQPPVTNLPHSDENPNQ